MESLLDVNAGQYSIVQVSSGIAVVGDSSSERVFVRQICLNAPDFKIHISIPPANISMEGTPKYNDNSVKYKAPITSQHSSGRGR